MRSKTVACAIQSSDTVSVRKWVADKMVAIELRSCGKWQGPRIFLTASRARLFGNALLQLADEVEAEQPK